MQADNKRIHTIMASSVWQSLTHKNNNSNQLYVRNYNNVLRQVNIEKDKCYLVIYGSSHISFLKYLFEMNPYFDVLDLNEILK